MIPRPSSNDTYPVVIWWACLTSLALLNTLCLLRRAHRTLEVVRDGYQPWLQRIRTRQFAMSALYVGGCAFRSALPCHHTLRHSLVRSFLCTGFVGRVVATIAELGAAVQVSLLLHELGVSTEDHATRNVSRAVVPLLFVAEIFSWYACVTTNYIGSIGEECLWAFCALLSLVSFLHAFPKYTGEQRRFVQKAIMINMVYFTYMTFIDVPQYIKGHIINTANGKTYYNIPDGLNTLLNVSDHKWTWSYCDWKYAMCWMTLYFSFACWASVGVINAPRLDQGLVKQKTK